MAYYVYLIKCSDNYLYTGLTWSIEKRLKEHKKGLSKITKNRRPVELVYQESFNSRIEAAKREKEIKGWSRKKKENLINSLH
ncbi:MAG: GIY-YIG nuclease family protein [Patescibacteria group bacterium]|nr:GIY-YIG nuclease family protein [Patescibacteria group bacterium]